MVCPAVSVLIPSKYPIPSTNGQVRHLRYSFPMRKQHVSVACSANFLMMENFYHPTKHIALLNYTKEKLWKFIPGPVKDFPWNKARSVALHELLVLGKKPLKWSLLACFAFSCLSDVAYSISRNKELVFPFGLFVGSLLTKYVHEIAQELLHEREGAHITLGLLGISCFFVLVKFISAYFLGGNDFLLHAANGGLMQVLWNWKNLPKQSAENSLPGDESIPMNADN